MVQIPYGGIYIDVELNCKGNVLQVKNVAVSDELALISDAFSNPLNSVDLTEFLNAHEHILLIVPDATRAAPNANILDTVLGELKHKKNKVFSGDRKPPTPDGKGAGEDFR